MLLNKIKPLKKISMVLALIFTATLSTSSAGYGVLWVQAQTNPISEYTLLEPLPCIPNSTTDSTGNIVTNCAAGTQIKSVKFETYVQYMFNLAIALAAVSAVFMIVWGGLQYMSTDSWKDKTDGRKKVWNAVLGLVLVLCSYIILRTINPKLVDINMSGVTPLKVQTSAWSNYYNSILPQLTQMTKETLAENNQILQQNKTYQQQIADLKTQKNNLCSSAGQDIPAGGDITCFGDMQNDPQIRSIDMQIAQYQNMITANNDRVNQNIFNTGTVVELGHINEPGTNAAYIVSVATRLENLYQNTKTETVDPATAMNLAQKNDDAMLTLIKKYSEVVKANPNWKIQSEIDTMSSHLPTDPTKRVLAQSYLTSLASVVVPGSTNSPSNNAPLQGLGGVRGGQ